MSNVTHPLLSNPGVEAALLRLGHAVKDAAAASGQPYPAHAPFTDKIAITTAFVYLGGASLVPYTPPEVVAFLDDQRATVENLITPSQAS